MSISTVTLVKSRIRAATEDSPIAVFQTGARHRYDAVFANTVKTQSLIKSQTSVRFSVSYIGTFFGSDGVEKFVSCGEVL